MLQHKNCFAKLIPLQKWEVNLSSHLMEDQWKKSCKTQSMLYQVSYNCPKNTSLLVLYTPHYNKIHYKNSSSNECWRGCGKVIAPHALGIPPSFTFLERIFLPYIHNYRNYHERYDWAGYMSVHVAHFLPALRPIVIHILLAAALIVPRKWKSEMTQTLVK